jgi:hypothetical protein
MLFPCTEYDENQNYARLLHKTQCAVMSAEFDHNILELCQKN